MDKDKILVAILMVLIVASLGFGGWMMFSGDSPKHKKKSAKTPVVQHATVDVGVVDISKFWEQDYIRSIFYSPAAEKQSKIYIQGIIKNQYNNGFKAMINSKLISIGESIDGYEVLQIDANGVKAKNLKTKNIVTLKVFE